MSTSNQKNFNPYEHIKSNKRSQENPGWCRTGFSGHWESDFSLLRVMEACVFSIW